MTNRHSRTGGRVPGIAAGIGALLLASLLPSGTAHAAEAESLVDGWAVTTKKAADGITYTRYTEPSTAANPRVVDVLVADPAAGALSLQSTFGVDTATAEKTTSQLDSVTTSATRKPYAGTNAGFFDTDQSTLVFKGIAAKDGVLQGAACLRSRPGAPAAVIQYGVPYVTELSTALSVTSSATGATRELDDINRDPGRVPGCAKGSDDEKFEISEDTYAWKDASEIVSFTPQYGALTPRPGGAAHVTEDNDPGVEVVLSSAGRVTAVYEGRGGRTVPSGGRILQGIGEGADWLRANAPAGAVLTLDEEVRDEHFDEELVLDASVDIVNGTYLLVRDAAYAYTGSNIKSDPRTSIGADGYGRTMLVTVTGTKGRAGATLDELAKLMLHLGAVDALNLDGGGSTAMVVGATLVTPSQEKDGTERPVGDAVYVGHGGYGLYATS